MQIDLNRPAPHFALLWKEARQLFSIGGAVLSGLVIMQLIGVTLATIFTSSQEVFEFFAYSAFFLGPFVFVLGAVGVNIGHERQSGTWTWNGGLPVQWFDAFLCKAASTVFGAILVAGALAAIPAAYLSANSERLGLLEADVGLLVTVVLVNILVLCALSMLFSLCIRDTLIALVMASVLVIIGNGFFFASQVESGPGVASQPISERVLLGILGTLAALIILPFVAVVFRYRWHTIDGLPLHRRVAAKVAPAPAKAAAWPMRTKRAGLLLSQIRLAFAHSASWLNIAFGLIAMWMSYCLVMPNREMMVFSPGLTPLLFFSVFAASMAFAGDNRNGFLMFLSDRGASPALVYWSRLLPATAYVMLPLMFVLCVTFSNAHGIRSTQPSEVAFFFYSQIVAAAAVLSLCFYSSICHSRPILSLAVAAIATLIGVLLAGGVVELSGTLANPVGLGWSTDWLLMHTIGWGWLCPLILFVAAWRSTKHRLLRGHATPAVAYPWWTALAFCAPVFMAASTAFLFLPKASAPVSVEQALTDAMVLPAPFASSDSSASTLEELQSSLQRPAQVATPVQWVGRREEIRSAIESTTSIFHRAIEARDFEQAALALKCHNALLSQMGTAMYAALQRSSRTAVEIYFDYEDLEKMSKFVPAGELMDNTSVQQAQALQEQQRVIYLAVLSGRLDADQLPPSPGFSANQFSWNPTLRTLAHYPPIRWRLERELYASR